MPVQINEKTSEESRNFLKFLPINEVHWWTSMEPEVGSNHLVSTWSAAAYCMRAMKVQDEAIKAYLNLLREFERDLLISGDVSFYDSRYRSIPKDDLNDYIANNMDNLLTDDPKLFIAEDDVQYVLEMLEYGRLDVVEGSYVYRKPIPVPDLQSKTYDRSVRSAKKPVRTKWISKAPSETEKKNLAERKVEGVSSAKRLLSLLSNEAVRELEELNSTEIIPGHDSSIMSNRLFRTGELDQCDLALTASGEQTELVTYREVVIVDYESNDEYWLISALSSVAGSFIPEYFLTKGGSLKVDKLAKFIIDSSSQPPTDMGVRKLSEILKKAKDNYAGETARREHVKMALKTGYNNQEDTLVRMPTIELSSLKRADE